MSAPTEFDAGVREVDHLGQVCVIDPNWCEGQRGAIDGLGVTGAREACAFAGCGGWGGDGGGGAVFAPSAPVGQGSTFAAAPPLAPVPVPAGGVLLATAIGAVVVIKRMRR